MSREHITSRKITHTNSSGIVNSPVCNQPSLYQLLLCIISVILFFMHRCMSNTVEDSWKSGIASIRESFKTAPQKLKQNRANTRRKKKRRGVIGLTGVTTIRYIFSLNIAYVQQLIVCLQIQIELIGLFPVILNQGTNQNW